MQISNVRYHNKKKSWFFVYLVLLFSAGVLIWFSQKSINNYWQQTYHQESPLAKLNQSTLWKQGGAWQDTMNRLFATSSQADSNLESNTQGEIALNLSVEDSATLPTTANEMPVESNASEEISEEVSEEVNEKIELNRENVENISAENVVEHQTVLAKWLFDKNLQIMPIKAPLAEEKATPSSKKQKVALNKSDKVFFAGDSLMQAIAPNMQKWLKENNISSINLSKQSTGLAYPSFFDWTKTIEQTLKQNKDIKLLVVFLGPNDPWDMPDEQAGRPYLKFKSAEWENLYRKRVHRIAQAAQKHNVKLIWVGIPHMRKAKLNSDMAYLNQVIRDELKQNAIYIPTAGLLSDGKNRYTDSINVNGKVLRVRSKDGIHFSLSGVQVISDHLKESINIVK